MDDLDFPGDVYERCRHALHEGACPSCGWRPVHVEGPLPPYEPDDLPGIRGI